MFKRQSILANERLQLAVDRKGRGLRSAGAPDVLPPGGELTPAAIEWDRFLICHVIHFPAERIESRHAVPLGSGEKHEGEREV
jgi:hypothetical protein